MNEHEGEPIRGLPLALPPGELLLWQGSPDPQSLARRGFHVGLLAAYFMLLAVWRFVAARSDGGQLRWAAITAMLVLLMGIAAIAVLAAMAWLTGRTTVYSITSRRLVMRFGIALPISVNIPFGLVTAAGLRVYRDGSGEIALALDNGAGVSFPIFWPHVRPWRLHRAEPMLRCVPNATQAAQILARALNAAAAGSQPLAGGGCLAGDQGTRISVGCGMTREAGVSDPSAGRPFPRGPLIGAAAMILLSLTAAGWGRLSGVHRADQAAVRASRDLRFADRPGGAIAIYDIRSGRPVDVVPAGTNGFLRATLRGLARERRRNGGDKSAPFRLAALADGRLILKDLVTGDRVDLEAFGATNAGVFARLLVVGRQKP